MQMHAAPGSEQAIPLVITNLLRDFHLVECNRKFKPLRWVHKGALVLFAKISLKLLRAMNTAALEEEEDRIKDLVAEAFFFFPTVLMNQNGKLVSEKSAIAILSELDEVDDLLLALLTRRNAAVEASRGIQQRKRVSQVSGGGDSFSAKARAEVERLVKGRNLSKAMKRLKQCGSVQRMVDANGDLTVEAAEVIRKLFQRNPPQEPQQWNGLDERPAVTAHVLR